MLLTSTHRLATSLYNRIPIEIASIYQMPSMHHSGRVLCRFYARIASLQLKMPNTKEKKKKIKTIPENVQIFEESPHLCPFINPARLKREPNNSLTEGEQSRINFLHHKQKPDSRKTRCLTRNLQNSKTHRSHIHQLQFNLYYLFLTNMIIFVLH